ncbi:MULTISPECIES: hypothetical protein [unclassified Paenibacillus]|uniref:hypothetical protein n=1 Tax=unclassified Paenibacillus TaxID=185978 RepID=UPI001C1215A6|nr:MULTISPECIES: hypothetical protein [unclassified Paenibacillus]MBU5441073.1 hypothetical protein [Paenibacillus sp. MSJ-34]CAH0119715.1 hypothetical protein PAE9249_02222 [Paenibacillus sp. CECT 9249]
MNMIMAILIICSLLTASLTIAFMVKGMRARKKAYLQRKAILAGGASAQAVINSIRQTNVQIDNQPEVMLDLTVTKQDGEVIHTVVKTVIPIVNIPAFQKGNIVEVKHMTIDNEQRFEVVGSYMP